MSHAKRAKRLVKGLRLTWTDDRPDQHTTVDHLNIQVTHANPVLRPTAREMFARFVDFIVVQTPFLWQVTTKTVFQYPNGMEQTEETTLTAFIQLTQLNDQILDEIRKDKRAGAHFKHVEFFVECLDIHNRSIAA